MTTCQEVMTRDPVCSLVNDTVDEAAQLMRYADVGALPVVDCRRNRHLIGIVTDRDLAVRVVGRGFHPQLTRVADVMTPSPIHCREDEDVTGALTKMVLHRVRRIPTVNAEGKLVGIITQADVATRLSDPQLTASVIEDLSRPHEDTDRAS